MEYLAHNDDDLDEGGDFGTPDGEDCNIIDLADGYRIR